MNFENLKILNSTDILMTFVEKFLEKVEIILICENLLKEITRQPALQVKV